MIKPLSIQGTYTLVFSGDPALDLPSVPTVADDADDKAKEAAKAAVAERDRVLKVARETGNWPIKPGESPTLFHFDHINGTARDYLDGEVQRNKLAPGEFASLIFRLAIRRIDNFGDLKVKLDRRDGFKIATTDVINELRATPSVGDLIVAELGGVVAVRTFESLDPL